VEVRFGSKRGSLGASRSCLLYPHNADIAGRGFDVRKVPATYLTAGQCAVSPICGSNCAVARAAAHFCRSILNQFANHHPFQNRIALANLRGHVYSECPANLLIHLGSNSLEYSESALISLKVLPDFDSTMRRFECEGHLNQGEKSPQMAGFLDF
jgi:hypothetical protein